MNDYTEMSPSDALKLPIDEFKLWITAQDDPDPPTPSAYPLHSNEGRCGFLESYIWFGEEKLFEAVSHIWDLLNEPKNVRCIYIGTHAGTGGSGKWALAKLLRRALREALDDGLAQPDWLPGQTLHDFHAASMAYFAASYAHYERTVQKYADILGGEPGRHDLHSAHVIKGPWRALTHRLVRDNEPKS